MSALPPSLGQARGVEEYSVDERQCFPRLLFEERVVLQGLYVFADVGFEFRDRLFKVWWYCRGGVDAVVDV